MKAALFIIALLLSACVTSNDFDRLRSDVRELQRTSAETRKDVDTVKEETTGVVKEDTLLSIRESQTDLLAKANENSRGLQELRGRFDESRYFTEKMFKENTSERDLLKTQITALEAQVKSLKDRLAVLEGQTVPKVQQTEPSGAADQPAGTPKAGESPADSVTGAYEAAYQLFKDKKYKEARTKFEAFLREYPKSELADNAQFWIAESYYAEKDFESAILSYETLLKKYPNSDKASGGMLKQGLAFIEIGDLKTGRIILTKLVEKHAGSKDAEVAKKKIAEMEKKSPKKK